MEIKGESSSDGDQSLWELMGQTRGIEPSSLFVDNVLGEVRQSAKTKRLFNPMVLAIAAVVILATAVVVNFKSNTNQAEVATTAVEEFDLTEEIASISELGELMVVADPASLSDEALLNLLY